MQITAGPLLSKINTPSDLKILSKEQMQQVVDELRQYIIDVDQSRMEMSCRAYRLTTKVSSPQKVDLNLNHQTGVDLDLDLLFEDCLPL